MISFILYFLFVIIMTLQEAQTPSKPKTPKSSAGSAILSIEKPTPLLKISSKTTYLTMTTHCIRHLADRSGSSFPAIYKALQSIFNKPDGPHIKQNLNKAIKQGIKEGRFVKVRNSFKVNSAWTKKEKEGKKRKEREKKQKEDKRKKVAQEERDKKAKVKVEEEKRLKRDRELENMTEEERKDTLEKERIKAERLKIQEEKQKKAKILAEKIRKRKFPMDDLELIKEDKLLHVKPPHPKTPPTLPLLISDYPTLNYSSGRRGVVSDVFQIFHLFRGDVGWRRSDTVDFKLSHLFHCCQEITNGNAKHNGTMPPLIVHLFLTALHHLTTEIVEFPELVKLGDLLNPLNWGEILRHYFDFMQEHSIAAQPSNILRDYADNDVEELPAHYYGYLGSPKETLAKAHAKLSKLDSYMLTAEECMCLLRVLCDDILANSSELEEEISNRMEEMYELTKLKKAAESNWRKVKFAYEGPKNPPKKKKENSEEKQNNAGSKDEVGKQENKEKESEESNNAKNSNEKAGSLAKPKVPKPTKKEYEAADKTRQRAVDNYDKGFRKLIARTEPVGYDRNHCGVYHFYHDPENVYLETRPLSKKDGDKIATQNRTWRIISCKSLFDKYVETLDIRGIREFHLDDNLIYKGYVRRHLYDDIRVQNMIEAKKREEEALQKKFEIAKEACVDSNRRSGRLVNTKQQELQEIEDEMNVFKALKSGSINVDEKETDLRVLTGFESLKEFEKKMFTAEWKNFRCSTLWIQSQCGGVLGPLISDILEIEKQCNKLVPWDRTDKTRNEWIDTLKAIKVEWEGEHYLQFGLNEVEIPDIKTPQSSKKTKYEKEIDESGSRSSKRKRSSDAGSKLSPVQRRLGILKVSKYAKI